MLCAALRTDVASVALSVQCAARGRVHPTDGWVTPDVIRLDLGVTLLTVSGREAR
jgi:hypothetical protein